MATTRSTWADLCRVAAIFGVLVIHASAPWFYQYHTLPRNQWLAATFLDSAARCSIPLFLMLSGALLLRPGSALPGPADVWRRVRRILLPLLAWGVAYLLYGAHVSGQPVHWTSLLTQAPMYHLWFAYMMIGVYLVLPVLQSIFRAVGDRQDLQSYLLVLWLVLTGLPVYADLPLLRLLHQSSFLGYGGYVIVGAFIVTRGAAGKTRSWGLLYAIGVLATFLLAWLERAQAGEPAETAFGYLSVNVFVASVAAFVLLARARPPARWSGVLHWTSDRVFLVYLMHPLVLERVTPHVAVLQLPVSLQVLLVTVVTFAVCLAIAAVLRLIPNSRPMIG